MLGEALGVGVFGTVPFASGILHDAGTIVLSAPTGTITTGGPTILVEWDSEQPQGDPQEWYRVRLRADGGSTDLFDTGYLAGQNESYEIDMDALELDVDDVTYEVYVDVKWPFFVQNNEQTDDDEFTVQWGKPHLTISSPTPNEIITAATGLTITWDSTDDKEGADQAQYRVIVRFAANDLVVDDTGWVTGTEETYESPVSLIDKSNYEILVQTKNAHGIRSD